MTAKKRALIKIVAGFVALSLVLTLVAAAASAESAQAPVGIQIKLAHLVLAKDQEGKLRVLEMIEVANNGDKRVESLEFPLPAGAKDVQIMAPGGLKTEAKNGVLSIPVALDPKGTGQAVFTLSLDAPEGSYTLAQKFSYPVEFVSVLTEKGVEVIGMLNRDLMDMGEAQGPGRTLRQWGRENMAAGDELKVNIQFGDATAPAPGTTTPPGTTSGQESGSGQTSGSSDKGLLNKRFHGGDSNVMIWQRFTGASGHGGMIGIIFIGIILIGLPVVGLKYYRTRINPVKPILAAAVEQTAPEELSERLSKEKSDLVRQIAELDRRHQTGEIAEEEYGHKRSEYKKRLVKVAAKLKEIEGPAD